MKIAILSLYHGDKFKNDTIYGRETIQNYCNKYGYDFIYDNEDLIKEHDREIQWTKILIIQKYLNNKYDYIVWIDADILILNPEKTIESFIDRLMNNKDIMFSRDFSGIHINNGVIFVKNTENSIKYFKEVWKHTGICMREQGSMQVLYMNNWDNCQNYIQVTENPTEYNPMWWEFVHGMFLIHFPGCNEPNRLPNSLRRMMDMFTPLFLKGDNGHDKDTEESFNQRIKWLNENAEHDLKYKKHLCNIQGWKYLPIELD
jgi:hypothetical protein